MPGSPKLPVVTCCRSLAAAWGNNKDIKIITHDSEVAIVLFICLTLTKPLLN